MPIVPIGAYDTPGGPYRTFYVPKSGGPYTFPIKMVGTSGGVVQAGDVYPFSCRPLQAFMDIAYRPAGYITGFAEGVGGFTVFANAGPLPNNAGRVDLMATNPFIDGAIGGTADPFGIPVYQFGVDAWVPPYSFDPVPSGWAPGDPPPAPWVDGDPIPDDWTPPGDYVPDVCTFDIAPTDAGYDYLAHSAVFLLTASGIHCESTPETPNAWITLGETADIGTYNVPYAITQNNGALRSGVIYVGGQHFIITQAGRPADHSGGDVPPPPVVYTKGPPCSATYTRGPDYDAGDYTRGSDPCGG